MHRLYARKQPDSQADQAQLPMADTTPTGAVALNKTWRWCPQPGHGWFEQDMPLSHIATCAKCDTLVSFRAMGAYPPPDTPDATDKENEIGKKKPRMRKRTK